MMSSVRLEVLWSPVHRDKFVTWGTEIFLYETFEKFDEKPRFDDIELSENSGARLLATNSNYHYVKCVDIYPLKGSEILMAVGQANGKVSLTSFGPSSFDCLGVNGMDLIPKHARQCNVVSWCHNDPQLIATGLDRYRSDHCILVWDIRSRSGPTTTAELGLSDMAHSLAWLQDHHKTLVVGMNNKLIKMVDLRDPSKAANSAQTKAVYGVTAAPYSNCMLASYVESQVAIWDIRAFEKPVLSLQQSKPITKILWCPTRNNLLGSLQRDSKSIYLHYIQQMEELDHSVVERSIKPGVSGQITSFSWHPNDENRLLAITLTGSLTDTYVSERITLNWAQSANIVWTHGQRTLQSVSYTDSIYDLLGDISSVMKKRASKGYGLQAELEANAELVDEEDLRLIWKWLGATRKLSDEGAISSTPKHPGIRSILGMDKTTPNSLTMKSELAFVPFSGISCNASAKIYRSEIRDMALKLCNWSFIHNPPQLLKTVEALESSGEITKAAAVAVFGLQLKTAIDLLSVTEHNTVSMALSGYNNDKDSVWRQACTASRLKLQDPYLRAIFAFLTADSDNYNLVLEEEDMAVTDRIAFALSFLSDSKMIDYLIQLTDQLTADGNLAGLILTGMCSASLPLLQQYLDNTGDVQSVSTIAMRTFPTPLLECNRSQYWISSYRELLDMWRMWNHRAQFDIQHNSRTSTRPEQQIYVTCNFCGKTLSTNQFSRNKGPFQRAKVSCCPHCRKPQPRCAICLVNMGTPSQSDAVNPNSGTKVNPFNNWYTWCQSCRHGGHSEHISQWFVGHQECPVTGCTCRCLSLDAASSGASV
uniref:WD repeat-containing protein mio n=3 Tax=Lygus hesperus TaxID=30085 RepID=A0A0A9ZA57_LYGHE